MFKIKASDTQCGFKMFSREAAKVISNNMHLQRWGFDAEIFKICSICEIQCFEMPIQWKEIKGSKINMPQGSTVHFLGIIFP